MTETNLTNFKINVMDEETKNQTTFGANELIMTPDNSVSDGVEKVKTIYDKDSTDADINWGYTNGIQSSTITDKNFTKYKKLRIYYCNKNTSIENDSWGRNNIIELDLSTHINFDYSASNELRYIAYTQNYNGGIIVKVNSEKTSFATVITDENNASSNSFVYRIEGVY